MLHKRTYKQVSVDNKSRTGNGGYVMYFKLFRQLLSQMHANRQIFSKTQYVMMNAIAYVKFVWWCGIKPLGQFTSKHTHIKGTYTLNDGVFENRDVNKTITYLLLGCAVFVRHARLTDEDINELLK